jgi:hypothetical protein
MKSIRDDGYVLRKTRKSGEARTMSPIELNRITNDFFGINISGAKYIEFYAGAILRIKHLVRFDQHHPVVSECFLNLAVFFCILIQ